MRSTKEWIGKSDDSAVPPHVRLRVFRRFDGVCWICTMPISGKRWICDHRIALCNGGENRERNLGPIHEACDYKIKTPRDVAARAANDRVASKHLGIRKPKGRPMPGSRNSGIKKRMDGTVEYRK